MSPGPTTPTEPTSDATNAPVGRREQKRLATRHQIVRAALDLFAERGFDDVTVMDIAERAGVDKATFFRHFSSKQAVVFADYVGVIGDPGAVLRTRPPDEPILEAVHHAMGQLVTEVLQSSGDEPLRSRLARHSPGVLGQFLILREQIIRDFSLAIAERMGVDPDLDARPYVVASAWVNAADWYREHTVRHAETPPTVDEAVEQISAIVRSVTALLD